MCNCRATIVPAMSRRFASKYPLERAVPSELAKRELLEREPTETELHQMEEAYSSAIINGRSIFEPIYHEKTHGIPAATIHLRSYHVPLISLFGHFVVHTAAALGIPASKPMPLPIQRSLWTVPKGPFAHKKSQENFDRKTYKRVIKAWDADAEVVERWVRYLEKHALAGVGMRVVRWERAPVQVGQLIAKSAQDAMGAARLDMSGEQVRALGKKIIKQETATAQRAASELNDKVPQRSS